MAFWAAAAPIIASALPSVISAFSKGKSAEPGGSYFQQSPQYAGVNRGMEALWSYLPRGLQALQEGKAPTWWQKYRPLDEAQRKAALYGAYYGKGAGAQGGNQWGPGILDTQRAEDIKAGRRGAGAGSNYAKQLQQYATGMTEIDDYLSKMGFEAMRDSESKYLSAMSMAPRGPQGDWQSYGQSAYQPTAWEQLAQGIGATAPYLGQIFGKSPVTTNKSSNVINQLTARA